MSPILEHYLVREIRTAMAGIALLLVVVVFGGLFTDVLSKITRGQFPPGLLFSQMALRIPKALNLLLPLAGFLGVLLAYTRLYRDSEMAVLRASGFSELGLLRPVIIFALPLAGLMALLGLYIAPTSQRIAADMAETANRSAAVAGLEPGRFIELSRSNAVIYAGELDKEKSFRDVLMVRELPDGQLQVVRAERGLVSTPNRDSASVLRLTRGERSQFTPGKNGLERASFASAQIALPESLQPEREATLENSASELLLNNRLGIAELQARISGPLMLLLLMLLAPALARSAPRQVRYDRIVIGVLLYLVYSQVVTVAKTWFAMGKTPAWLGLWWVHGLFTVALLVAYRPQLVSAWRTRGMRLA